MHCRCFQVRVTQTVAQSYTSPMVQNLIQTQRIRSSKHVTCAISLGSFSAIRIRCPLSFCCLAHLIQFDTCVDDFKFRVQFLYAMESIRLARISFTMLDG